MVQSVVFLLYMHESRFRRSSGTTLLCPCMESLPGNEHCKQASKADKTDNESEGYFDTSHVRQHDSGDLIGRESMSDLRRTRPNNHLRVDFWSRLGEFSHHAVHKSRLRSGDGERASDGLEDWTQPC